MKVFISTDFEGVSGIVDWDQIMMNGRDYDLGRRLLLAETNAAIDGALAAGATEIVVNDSHSVMRNLPPDELHGHATSISGKHKPLYMMQGLDETFDAIFFVGYHGSIGTRAVLSHSYNPRAIWEVRIDGRIAGETALNALVAAHYRVPITLITGDQITAAEAREVVPQAECVTVKEAYTRFSAASLHPEIACARIREAAARALRPERLQPPQFVMPVRVEITFLTADMADAATWLRGVEPVPASTRAVTFSGENLLDLFRTFVTIVLLTRALVE
jgi:D-amino peptidase